MYYIKILACLGLAILASTVESRESVPVLIWDSGKLQRDIPAVSALQIVSLSAFQDKYLNSFQPKDILLFLQDTLSVEDLSSHADELKVVTKKLETSHSLYLPAVEGAASIVHSLAAHDYKVTTIKSGSSLAGLTLNKDEKNLVVVELPSTITNPSRKNALQKSDEVIDNVLRKIGKIAPFTVIFTGEKPSVGATGVSHLRNSRSVRIERAIQSDAFGTNMFYQSDCVMLYLKGNITVNKNGVYAYTLSNSNYAGQTTGECPDAVSDTVSSININFKDVGDFDKVKISFTFRIKGVGRNWILQEGDIYEQDETQIKAMVYPKIPMSAVPVGKAYICSGINRLYSKDSESSDKYEMVLPGLQVEAFSSVGQEQFGSSWDCVGFFTIPIWMGIFTGFIFLFILAFGLYMVSSVKTMDRFDDPKAKHFMMVPSVSD